MSEAAPVAGGAGSAAASASRAHAPSIDSGEAERLFAAARRAYSTAELVQQRRLIGNVDSAVPAQRALTLVFELVLRLHGDPVPSGFGELAARARAIAEAENLLPEDLAEDVNVIEAMHRRAASGDPDVSGPEDRSYDRAFVRCAEWLRGARSYLDERFPPSLWRRRGRATAIAAGGSLLFVSGLVIGHYVRGTVPGSELPTDSAAARLVAGLASADRPSPSGSPSAGAAFGANTAVPSFPPLQPPVRLLVTDPHFSCRGCWPAEGSIEVPYVWTTSKVDLTVRGLRRWEPYRIALGIADRGSAEAVQFEVSGKQETVRIESGLARSTGEITTDGDGTLHWSIHVPTWKPADHVTGSKDQRELGVALADIRIDVLAGPEDNPRPK